jgi:hypothetical protein
MIKKLGVLTMLFWTKVIIFSQTISCSNFSITGIYPDTINPNDYQISLNFNANQSEFVAYPHFSAVLNCNGYTLATGDLFYFGQLGQTVQDYPVTITSNSWCEP